MRRAILFVASAFTFVCSCLNAVKADEPVGVVEGLSPNERANVIGTLRMLASHQPLRQSDLDDPDSELSRALASRMMNEQLKRKSLPAPPAMSRLTIEPDAWVGTLETSMSLDNKGLCNASIELNVPKGRANLAPNLSLFHGGGFYHGNAGHSFNLSHGYMQQIVRGRTLAARHGVAESSCFTQSDRLFLDGKLLLCVSGEDTYGKPGSVYRTEVDGGLVIEAIEGREYIAGFRVTDKDGRQSYFGSYGGDSNALVRRVPEDRDQSSVHPQTYLLKRVEDPHGNYIQFDYETPEGEEPILVRIVYTGGIKSAPYYEVRLDYQKSIDETQSFSRGIVTEGRRVLREVSVLAGKHKEIVARYELHYDTPQGALLQRLVRVDAWSKNDEGQPLRSIPSVQLRWADLAVSHLLKSCRPVAIPHKPGSSIHTLEDMRNGIAGFLVQRDQSLGKAQWSEETNSFTESDLLGALLPLKGDRVVRDFSGDLRADVAVIEPERLRLWESKKHGFNPPQDMAIEPKWIGSHVGVCDRHGVSQQSLVFVHPDRIGFWSSTAGSWTLEEVPVPWTERSLTAVTDVWFEDLNQDGREDMAAILQFDDGSSEMGVALMGKQGAFRSWETIHRVSAEAPGKPTSTSSTNWGDCNGDGLLDLMIRGERNEDKSRRWLLMLNHSTSLEVGQSAGRQFQLAQHLDLPEDTFPSLVDVNQDGFEDVFWTNSRGEACYQLWAGRSFSSVQLVSESPLATTENAVREKFPQAQLRWDAKTDFNCDGSIDWILRDGSGEGKVVGLLASPVANEHSPRPNWLTDLADGLGNTRSVSYRSASSRVVMSVSSDSEGLIVPYRGGRLVVSDRWNDEGAGRPSHFTYNYSEPRFDYSARGWLGFGAFTTLDETTRMLKYHVVHLSFPMTGLTKREQTFLLMPKRKRVELMAVSHKVYDHRADWVRSSQDRYFGTLLSTQIESKIYRAENRVSVHTSLREKAGELEPIPTADFWEGVLGIPTEITRTRSDRQSKERFAPLLAKAAKAAWTDLENEQTLWRDFVRFPGLLTDNFVQWNEVETPTGRTAHRYNYHDFGETDYHRRGLVSSSLEEIWENGIRIKSVEAKKTYAPGNRKIKELWVKTKNEKREELIEESLSEYDVEGNLTEKYEPGVDAEGKSVWQRVYRAKSFDEAVGGVTDRARKGYYPETLQYNRISADVRKIVSTNGWTAEYEYDGFAKDVGSKIGEEGKIDRKEKFWTLGNGSEKPLVVDPPPGSSGVRMVSLYKEIHTKTGEADLHFYFDRFGHRMVTIAIVSESDSARIDHVYDELGQEIMRSEPFPVKGKPEAWERFEYDPLGNRVSSSKTKKK